MRLCVLFHRLGPYHHARLRALSEHCELSVIEYSRIDNTYDWDIVDIETPFPIFTLFANEDINSKSVGEIFKALHIALDKIKPDVVAIPGWSAAASLQALSWCHTAKIPAVLMSDSAECDEVRRASKEWIKSRIVKKFSSALVAGSRHVSYAEKLGMPHEHIFAGYDVVDNLYFKVRVDEVQRIADVLRNKYDLPARYFLASNRFVEKKNLPRLLKAYALYIKNNKEQPWCLVMLGDGPQKSMLLDLTQELGIQDYVRFMGFKQYHELPVYYGLAEAFVHASTSEQWGLVVNEAMASGLPVLVSERCGCAPDLVKNDCNGFTFDPYDVNALAKLMGLVSSELCDRAAMGSASRKIINHWSPETFASGLVQAAETALAVPMPKTGMLDKTLLLLASYR